MKTVRAPKAPHPGYHIECGKEDCAAVMQVARNELREVHDQRDGTAYVMKCPHCHVETWIDAGVLEKFRLPEGT